jgi:hypothetical protein
MGQTNDLRPALPALYSAAAIGLPLLARLQNRGRGGYPQNERQDVNYVERERLKTVRSTVNPPSANRQEPAWASFRCRSAPVEQMSCEAFLPALSLALASS